MTEKENTRHKLRKSIKEKGKVPVTDHLKEFEEGEKVIIDIEPSVQDGMPHPKFQGKVGEVLGKQGECFKVEVKDNNGTKELICDPVHVKEWSP